MDLFAEIRDRGLEFYDSSNVGYSNLYLVSRPGHDDPESGIIVSKQFDVRVLYDPEEHNWVAVASPMMEALYRESDPETDEYKLAKVNDDPDIYILDAWSANLNGEDLRDNIEECLKSHRRLTMRSEQFYMDATPVDEADLDGDWAQRTVNARLGFLNRPIQVTEEEPPTSENRSCMIYARPGVRAEGEENDFVRFPKMPSNRTFGFLDQPTTEPKDFSTSLLTLASFTNAAATNFRKGKRDQVPMQKKAKFNGIKNERLRSIFEYACNSGLQQTQKILQNIGKTYKDTVNTKWKEALIIGLGLGAAVTVQQHVMNGNLQSLPKNLIISTLGSLSFKFREELINYAWNCFKDPTKEQNRINEARPLKERSFGHLYAANTAENKNRHLRKGDPERLRKLIAVDHKQTKIPELSRNGRPENMTTRDDNEFLREYRYLTIRERLYGSNIAAVGNTNMGWELYANGGVCFRHVEEGEDFTVQQAYFALDRNNAASKKAPLDVLQEIADSQDDFEEGKIGKDELIQVKKITFIRGRLPDDHILAEQFKHTSPYQVTFSEDNLTVEKARQEIKYAISSTTKEAADDYGDDQFCLTEKFEASADPLSPLGAVQRLTELERQRRKVALAKLEGEGIVTHLKPKSYKLTSRTETPTPDAA